ncbi:unnamed protein product [Hydatigera taeniaeformis]|uniref:snRNA-activating protein complex subunit 3 n=1 Tax=Hydatigena taeniaeformis TaxID=6205 RepID=A0A0R3WNH8_HYDTA|nr:unnamed protein product [Hydatigera taeniaeformis]
MFVMVFITQKARITNPNIRLLRVSCTACTTEEEFNWGWRLRSSGGVPLRCIPLRGTRTYSWGTKWSAVVPMVAQPRTDGGGSPFHMNGGFDPRLPERAGAIAQNWALRSSEARRHLFTEADRYCDFIIVDYIDTYINLTYKLITSRRWVSAFCRDLLMSTFCSCKVTLPMLRAIVSCVSFWLFQSCLRIVLLGMNNMIFEEYVDTAIFVTCLCGEHIDRRHSLHKLIKQPKK